MVRSLGFELPVCKTRDGQEQFQLRGHTGTVFSVAFSPDGSLLVSTGADKVARVWDARGGFLRASLRGHADVVTRARFSLDGQRIATASLDGTVREWEHLTFTDALQLQTGDSRIESAGLAADGRRAWLLNRRGELFVVSISERSLQRVQSAPSQINHVVLAADGATLFTASADGTISRIKVPEGTVIARWPQPRGTGAASGDQSRRHAPRQPG